MFANVQTDDHYCPDNADYAHQGICKFPGGVDVRGRPERLLLIFCTVPSASNLSLMRAMVRRVGGGFANSLVNRRCTSVAFLVFQ